MPKEVEIDGVVEQYYTPEEIESARAEALSEKEDEFTKRQEELDKQQEDFAKRQEELDEMQNPNIKILREKAKRLEALEKSGKSIDENGQVVDTTKGMTAEDITRTAVESTRREMLGARLGEYLDSYDEEKRKVVEHFYNKVSSGEEVTLRNMGEYIGQAEKLADVDEPNKLFNKLSSSGGKAPAVDMGGDKKSFAETDEGQEWAGRLGLKI